MVHCVAKTQVKVYSNLTTVEWDILNPDQLINLEIKFMRKTNNI